MHLAPHAPLFRIIRNHQQHTVNLHCMCRHQLPHSHLICTKPLYLHMYKIEPITTILINNKFTHHHSLLIHNSHNLLTLTVPPPYFPQYPPTNSPSAHSTDSSILLALQKQWEHQEKLDMERNQMEKQKEERKRMKEEREQRKEDRK